MLLNFFATCNKIGAFTLGGGYAMIPIMEREFVDKNKWMEKQEFMDIMVVAQTTPGIFAIDMASHIGYKLKGVWGGIVGAIGIALPSIIAILIIAMFFQHFKDNYCQHQQVQFLDTDCMLCTHRIAGIRCIPYLCHHSSRCTRLAIWQNHQKGQVKKSKYDFSGSISHVHKDRNIQFWRRLCHAFAHPQ